MASDGLGWPRTENEQNVYIQNGTGLKMSKITYAFKMNKITYAFKMADD